MENRKPIVYNRLALTAVSVLALSHWRLDITVVNYIVQKYISYTLINLLLNYYF
ncbi:hypothetical protein J2Z72_000137 [Peptostreptococcus canis]|nr:hypothetical protein [Peptostreptococcus canis]